MIGLVCAALALAIVGLVVLVAVFDWAGHLRLAARLPLYALAAGLVWAGPSRFLAAPGPGLGDLLFLAGVLGVLAGVYGQALVRHADALDGVADGRLRLIRRVLAPRAGREPFTFR